MDLQKAMSLAIKEGKRGSSDFVMEVLEEANERLKQSRELKSKRIDIDAILGKIANHYGFNVNDLKITLKESRYS